MGIFLNTRRSAHFQLSYNGFSDLNIVNYGQSLPIGMETNVGFTFTQVRGKAK